MVARIEMKLGTYAYYNNYFLWQLSMTTHMVWKTLRQFYLILLLHTSNLLTVATTHGDETWYACIVHCFHDNPILFEQQALLFKITSSLLKLVNGSTHGGETWYTCVLHGFHDEFINEYIYIASDTFLYNYFFTLKTCQR